MIELFVVLLNVVLKACKMPIPHPSLPFVSLFKQHPLSHNALPSSPLFTLKAAPTLLQTQSALPSSALFASKQALLSYKLKALYPLASFFLFLKQHLLPLVQR